MAGALGSGPPALVVDLSRRDVAMAEQLSRLPAAKAHVGMFDETLLRIFSRPPLSMYDDE